MSTDSSWYDSTRHTASLERFMVECLNRCQKISPDLVPDHCSCISNCVVSDAKDSVDEAGRRLARFQGPSAQ